MSRLNHVVTPATKTQVRRKRGCWCPTRLPVGAWTRGTAGVCLATPADTRSGGTAAVTARDTRERGGAAAAIHSCLFTPEPQDLSRVAEPHRTRTLTQPAYACTNQSVSNSL